MVMEYIKYEQIFLRPLSTNSYIVTHHVHVESIIMI